MGSMMHRGLQIAFLMLSATLPLQEADAAEGASSNYSPGGYVYDQLSGDSGSGALLGDFKGESYGLGPVLSWVPEAGRGNVALSAKWLHDLDAKNRLEADYDALTPAIQF